MTVLSVLSMNMDTMITMINMTTLINMTTMITKEEMEIERKFREI